MTKADPALAQATQNLEGFEFFNVVSDQQGVGDMSEIWRCQKPGTSANSFDICVTKRGIAVFGDMDGLLFQAGYGLKFLAGDDITYIHRKLDEQCKEREFSRDFFLDAVLSYCDDALEALGLAKPEHPDKSLSGAELFIWWTTKGLQAIDTVGAKLSAMVVLEKVRELTQAAATIDSLDDAVSFFREHASDDGIIGPDWYEHQLQKPAHNLVMRLHMVNQAAKRIVALDNEPEASAEQRRPRP